MAPDSTSIKQHLEQLRQLTGSVAEQLSAGADQLERDGTPPSSSLLLEMQSLQRQVAEIRSLLHPGSSTDAAAWNHCDDIAQEIQRQESAQRVVGMAAQVLTIQTRDGQGFEALAALRQEASQIISAPYETWPASLWSTIKEGTHPWSALITMIQTGDTLDDDQWTRLNSIIEDQLGAPLAIAAARGRMMVGASEGSAASEALIVDTPLAAPQQPEAPSAPIDDVAPTRDESDDATLLPFRPRDIVLPGLMPLDHETHFERSSVALRSMEKLRSESSTLRAQATQAQESLSLATPAVEPPRIAEPSLSIAVEKVAVIEPAPAFVSGSVFDDDEPEAPAAVVPPTAALVDAMHRPTAPHPEVANAEITRSIKSIFDEDEVDDLMLRERQSTRLPVVTPEVVEALPFQPSPLADRLLAEARFRDATGPSSALATEILNGLEADRVSKLPDLILTLVHEGRPGLAYHLARGLEERSHLAESFVPSWLIRVWTFSHALLFPRGQLAGLIQDDLRQNELRIARSMKSDWELTLSLLIRAATLRPAIIAPSTRAGAALRAFDLRDGCVQLYNYCSRVGSYGERIQGVYPGLFKQSAASTPYAEQWSALRSDVRAWLDEPDSVGIQYEISAPLFQKNHWSLRAGGMQRHPELAETWKNWQIALQYAKSLVDPVVEDRRSELNRVRTEVEEVSTKLAATSDLESHEVFSQPEIRAYLRQALTFAQRWITLHQGAASSESQTYLPQMAVELRTEIESRHDALLEELQVLATTHPTFEVRTAVACLMLSVQEIRDMVDPLTPSESTEPDPRHLLHAELLKITSIPLSSSWEPEIDRHTVEDEILTYLSQPQPDWTTAFKLHLSEGNHTSAERILSMSIWSEAEKEALQSVLVDDRERQRGEFATQVERVRQLLQETVHLDVLPETEKVVYQTRLAKLQRIVESDADVSSGIPELNRLKVGLMRQREREAERIRNRLRQLGTPNPAVERAVPLAESSATRQWVMDFDS